MSLRRALVAVVVAVALATPGGAETLRLKFKPGEKVTFRDQMAMALERTSDTDMNMRLQMRSDSKVRQTVKHLADGLATLEIETLENSTETIPEGGKPGKSEEKGDGERIKISERGLISERVSLGKDTKSEEGIDTLAVLQRVIDGMTMPEEDVEPGGEWSDTYEVALTDKGLKGPKTSVDLSGKFERLVMLKGRECAELVVDFTAPLDIEKTVEIGEAKVTCKGSVMGHLTMYLDVERGESLAETATYGGHLELNMEVAKHKVRLAETLKMNTKTHKLD
ncbi:MAG: hypothetical protein HZB16_14030 [Armatimonadetes bacterium]|nr:hypothetical protein [Armatimonadota bacterium]